LTVRREQSSDWGGGVNDSESSRAPFLGGWSLFSSIQMEASQHSLPTNTKRDNVYRPATTISTSSASIHLYIYSQFNWRRTLIIIGAHDYERDNVYGLATTISARSAATSTSYFDSQFKNWRNPSYHWSLRDYERASLPASLPHIYIRSAAHPHPHLQSMKLEESHHHHWATDDEAAKRHRARYHYIYKLGCQST